MNIVRMRLDLSKFMKQNLKSKISENFIEKRGPDFT